MYKAVLVMEWELEGDPSVAGAQAAIAGHVSWSEELQPSEITLFVDDSAEEIIEMGNMLVKEGEMQSV